MCLTASLLPVNAATYTATIKYHINGGSLNANTTYYGYQCYQGTIDGNPYYWFNLSNSYANRISRVLEADLKTYHMETTIWTTTITTAQTKQLANVANSFGWYKTGYHIDASKAWKVSSNNKVLPQNSAVTTKQINNGTQITSNKTFTVKANWLANTYTVKYNGNGATSGSTANSTHTYGTAKALTANGYTKTGYTFKGWAKTQAKANAGTVAYTNKQSVSNLTSTNNGTVTLYAVWEEKTANLTYNANGHGTAPAAVTMKYTTATKAANAISASGYVFKEWNTKADGTGTAYAPGTQVKAANVVPSATTLYAIWKHPGTITITKRWTDELTGEDAENRKPPRIIIEGERVPQ